MRVRSFNFIPCRYFPRRMTIPYGWPMIWMRKRGNRVVITSGKYAGQRGAVEANVHQRTVDYPDELTSGYHIMLDNEGPVTVRWDQVETLIAIDKNGLKPGTHR